MSMDPRLAAIPLAANEIDKLTEETRPELEVQEDDSRGLMDTDQQWRFRIGDSVVDTENQKLGDVSSLEPDTARPSTIIIEKGLLGNSRYAIPIERVANYDGETIYLNTTEAELVPLS